MRIRRPDRVARVAVVLAACTGSAACAGGGGNAGDESAGATVSRSIEEVQEAHTPEWMALPGVVGTGLGRCDGEPCIKVFVARRTPELEERIPDEAEGYRVALEVTGPFRAQDTTPDG